MKRNVGFSISSILVGLILLMLINACKHDKDEIIDPDENTVQVPVLTTETPGNISQTSCTSGGIISSDGGAPVTARGVCWSTNPAPTIDDQKTNDGTGQGSFTSQISGLSSNTSYNLRAYATNSAGTAYGDAISFTTLTTSGPTITDTDGNVYQTILIGTQLWMAENLKSTKFNNGNPIPHITDRDEWRNLTTAAYCWYENDLDTYGNTYGALYKWFTVNSGNLCPTGWHIPTDAEWTVLTDYLGGTGVAGGKLKEAGIEHWNGINTGATNETGFTALPGGNRKDNGHFDDIHEDGYWWSATAEDSSDAWFRAMFDDKASVDRDDEDNESGFSVRCLRD